MIRVKEAITAGQQSQRKPPGELRGRVGWSQSISLAASVSKAIVPTEGKERMGR